MRGPRAEARVGAVDEASTAAREGACAPRNQPRQRMAAARIFHSHIGKSREKPYENRGANTFECVVETTRHAGLETCEPKLGLPTAGGEACATTLECRCVSRRMVARLQRLMATVAANPGRCPGLSCGGLSGLVFAPPCWKKEAMDLPLTERLRGCDTLATNIRRPFGRAEPCAPRN
jgi:hypothetical protein